MVDFTSLRNEMASFSDVVTNSLLLSKILDFLPIDDVIDIRMLNRAVHQCSKRYFSSRKKIDFGLLRREGKLNCESAVARFASLVNNLSELYLENSGRWITDRVLIGVLSRNTKMKKLSLRDCESKSLSDDSLVAIAFNCKQLEYLCLGGCNWFTPQAFPYLANCKLLKSLCLERCESVENEGLAIVLRNTKILEEISLRYCKQLSGYALALLGEHCPQLKVLDFSRCREVDISAAKSLAKGCKHLREVDLTNTRMSKQALITLGKAYNHNLIRLSLAATDVDSEVLVTFFQSRNLEHVDVSFCPRVGVPALMTLSMCHRLRFVDLTSATRDFNKAIEVIGSECLQLEVVILTECRWLMPGSLIPMATKGTNLRRIDLEGCRRIDDAALISLFKGHPRLRSLNIAGCCKITGRCIKQLGLSCKGLESLDISKCYLIQDECIDGLIQNCKLIETLKMSDCYWLSAKSLEHISTQLKQLKELCINGCKSVTHQAAVTVLSNSKKLKYFDVTNSISSFDDVSELRKICTGNILIEN